MPRSLAALLASLCLGLAACGSGDAEPAGSTSTSSSAAPAADGESKQGTGYSFPLPSGWADETASTKSSAVRVDLLVIEKEAKDGFRNNINVIREEADVSLDELEDTLPKQIEAVGASIVSGPSRTTLDGEPAIELESKNANGQSLVQLQLARDGAVYTISATSREPGLREFADLKRSWRWS